MVTMAVDFIRYRLRDKSADDIPIDRWRVPLIEFFGWTTVVAIISFGARHMDFDFLRNGDSLGIIIAVLAVPTCMTLFTRRDLCDLRAIKAIVLTIIIIIASVYVSKTEDKGKYAIVIQSAYLVLWMPVLSMDGVLSREKCP